MGALTAPVCGSGRYPAWMARVAGPYARYASALERCSLIVDQGNGAGCRGCRTKSRSTPIESLLDLDSLLSPEDLELRTMVRQFGEQRLRPHIAEWFETGDVPVRDLA